MSQYNDPAPQQNTPASPPRKVPVSILIQLLFGGFSNQFGWLFFGFGMIFVFVFGTHIDFSEMSFTGARIKTVSGIITSVENTNARENRIPVYAYKYSFRDARQGRTYKGISYTSGRIYEIEQQVSVEYLADNPEMSRIKGARRAEFSPWAFVFIPIFPLIGLIFIASGLYKGIKAGYLLSRGIMGEGTLKSKQPTNTRINRQRVYKLTFEFVTEDNRHFNAVCKTHETRLLEDDAKERLFYDPVHPSNAVMLDNLPGSPGFDEAGLIKPQPLITALLPLITPVLAIAINTVVLMLVF